VKTCGYDMSDNALIAWLQLLGYLCAFGVVLRLIVSVVYYRREKVGAHYRVMGYSSGFRGWLRFFKAGILHSWRRRGVLDRRNRNCSEQGEKRMTDEPAKPFKFELNIKEGAEGHTNLGTVYRSEGRVDDAIKEYEGALKIDPNHALAHYNLGNLYHAQGKLKEAIREYQQALKIEKIDRNRAFVHYDLGVAYHTQGRLKEAIKEYQQAVTINPNDEKAHTNLGSAYRKQGKLVQAIAEYAEAIRITPNRAESHYNLGLACESQGKVAEAVAEYREVLRLNPDFAQAHTALGRCLLCPKTGEEKTGPNEPCPCGSGKKYKHCCGR